MKIDAISGISSIDLASFYQYLEQKGLSTYFTPTAIDDNSGQRYLKETGYRAQDLQYMLDKLQISQNKFFIIRLLNRGDIISLLYLLDKDQLVEAMNLFPRTKLIQFIHFLPKAMILKMLLWVMPLRSLLQFFSQESLFHILRSQRLEVSSFVIGFENMPIEMLQNLMMEITGQNVEGMSHKELRAMFMQLKKEQILEGMKKLPQKHLFEFIFQEVKKDPELLMMIPRGELMKVVSMMPKPNLVELFRLLDENMLIMFLSQLPEKFLTMAAAMLDDNTLGYVLIHQHPDLVAALANAA